MLQQADHPCYIPYLWRILNITLFICIVGCRGDFMNSCYTFFFIYRNEKECITTVEIEQLLFSAEYVEHKDKIASLKEKLKLTNEKITDIQKITVGQFNNPTWFVARKHRLTARNIGRVLKACKRGRFPPSLFHTVSGNTNLDGIKQIQWGRYNEMVAIEKFENEHSVKIIKIYLHSQNDMNTKQKKYLIFGLPFCNKQ